VLLADLTKLVNDPQIKFEVQPDAGLAAPSSLCEEEPPPRCTSAKSSSGMSDRLAFNKRAALP
jgi:hypothetical protein